MNFLKKFSCFYFMQIQGQEFYNTGIIPEDLFKMHCFEPFTEDYKWSFVTMVFPEGVEWEEMHSISHFFEMKDGKLICLKPQFGGLEIIVCIHSLQNFSE